eukprot:6274612-Prymnesium_polylepis.1
MCSTAQTSTCETRKPHSIQRAAAEASYSCNLVKTFHPDRITTTTPTPHRRDKGPEHPSRGTGRL